MKKVLLLVNKIGPRSQEIADYLAKKFGKKASVALAEFGGFVFKINQSDIEARLDNTDVRDFDVVYFMAASKNLRLAATLALVLRHHKIPFIDEFYENLEIPGNKLHSIVKLVLKGLPVVPSIYVPRRLVIPMIKNVVDEFGLPLFAKNIFSQKRKGLFLIAKPSDADKMLKEDSSFGFIFQKQIEIGKEYRLVAMGDKIVAIHEEAKRKFKGRRIVVDEGESLGGWVSAKNVPYEVIKISIEASKALGLNIAGIDACIEKGTGRVYIFEANWAPGLTLDAKISPELPGLAEYIETLIN